MHLFITTVASVVVVQRGQSFDLVQLGGDGAFCLCCRGAFIFSFHRMVRQHERFFGMGGGFTVWLVQLCVSSLCRAIQRSARARHQLKH